MREENPKKWGGKKRERKPIKPKVFATPRRGHAGHTIIRIYVFVYRLNCLTRMWPRRRFDPIRGREGEPPPLLGPCPSPLRLPGGAVFPSRAWGKGVFVLVLSLCMFLFFVWCYLFSFAYLVLSSSSSFLSFVTLYPSRFHFILFRKWIDILSEKNIDYLK